MIITCPQCATTYSMSAVVVGDEGRTVRCSKCGAVWHQERVAGGAAPQMTAAPPRRQEPAPAYPQPSPPPPPGSGGFPYGAPAQPDPAPLPQPIPTPRIAEEQRVREPPPPPVEEPRPAAPPPEEEAAREAEEDDSVKIFPPDTEQPGPDMAPADAVPDEEPVPQVFTPFRARPDGADEPRGRRWGLILGIPLLVLLVVAAVGYFGRDQIIARVPQVAPIYRALGLSAEIVGAGLQFREGPPATRIENNNDGLIVNGIVVNISDQPRPVPLIKIVFLNPEGVGVQSLVMQPPKAELVPDEQMSFQARFERVVPTARKFEFTFTTPELEGRSAVVTTKN